MGNPTVLLLDELSRALAPDHSSRTLIAALQTASPRRSPDPMILSEAQP